jgi:hypothetical protein
VAAAVSLPETFEAFSSCNLAAFLTDLDAPVLLSAEFNAHQRQHAESSFIPLSHRAWIHAPLSISPQLTAPQAEYWSIDLMAHPHFHISR